MQDFYDLCVFRNTPKKIKLDINKTIDDGKGTSEIGKVSNVALYCKLKDGICDHPPI